FPYWRRYTPSDRFFGHNPPDRCPSLHRFRTHFRLSSCTLRHGGIFAAQPPPPATNSRGYCAWVTWRRRILSLVSTQIEPIHSGSVQFQGRGVQVSTEFIRRVAAHNGENIQRIAHHVGHRYLGNRQADFLAELTGAIQPLEIIFITVSMNAHLIHAV